MEQSGGDLGARVRAARGYCGLNQAQLGDRLGVSRQVVAAIEDNDPRHELTVAEAQRIAAVCGVPVTFLTSGWHAPSTLVEMVRALEERMRLAERDRDLQAERIAAIYEHLETRFAQLASEALEQGSRQRRKDDPPRGKEPPAP